MPKQSLAVFSLQMVNQAAESLFGVHVTVGFITRQLTQVNELARRLCKVKQWVLYRSTNPEVGLNSVA